MKFLRKIVIIALAPLLSSCFQLQIIGSVSGGAFIVSPLRQPGQTVYSGAESWDDADWLVVVSQEDWDSWAGFLQLALLGIFYPDSGSLDPSALYLITASGGADEDANGDLLRDAIGTPVQSSWYAIVTGAQIQQGGFKVSALTDAIYRWILPDLATLSDQQVLQRLQQAAELTVTDANEDGVTNYNDSLFWTRIINGAATYKHQLSLLDAHGAALINGASDAQLESLARSAVEGSGLNTAYWRQLVADMDDKTFATAQFLYASTPNPATCVAGSLTPAARERALQAVNEVRKLHMLTPVSYSSLYDADVQASALIQRASSFLDHTPATGAPCYTQEGFDASAGNLALASQLQDPAADVVGWTNDSFNISQVAAAGHRRWVLNPFMAYTTYGQVDGASTLNVSEFDREIALTPAISEDYVAFPYGNYPYPLLSTDPSFPTPWSFTVIEDKSSLFGNQHDYFSNANITVTRTRDGGSMTLINRYSDMIGFAVPNFLSWEVVDWEQDTEYEVTIAGVSMQSGATRTFSYKVYVDFANLVDISEPREAGDVLNGQMISGSLFEDADEDSYELPLSGNVTFTANRPGFGNWTFFISLYGPDKRLVHADDKTFSVNLDAGQYTVVISNCASNLCYSGGGKSYTATIN